MTVFSYSALSFLRRPFLQQYLKHELYSELQS